MENDQTLSVAQYLDLINETMRLNIPSNKLAVEGEISDFRIAQEKWISFDLKDEEEQAVLKCFMTVWQLKIPVEDGMRVQISGYPKIYERFGTFKMNVQTVCLVGEGALRRAYELLKKKLETEGLFEVGRKRALPRFPSKVGVITSRDAAAFGDFKRVLNNRWGGVDVLHTHVHVQGKMAVSEILGAFHYFNALPEDERPDVLVLTRGGGGLEDLHAFNDEEVARAVFQSHIPVVVGVGHERDESLCDFVADVRASTPSNAAERIVPDRKEVFYEMQTMKDRIQDKIELELSEKNRVVNQAARMISFIVEREQNRVMQLTSALDMRFTSWHARIKDRVMEYERLFKHLDPKKLLERGYSLVTHKGKVIKDVSTLDIGMELHVQFAKGTADTEVLRLNGKGKQKLI